MATAHCHYCQQPIANRAAKFCPRCRQPQILHERYRLIRVLGQGGFGIVYEAEDIRLGDRRCALKRLPTASLAEQRQIEAEAAILTKHANRLTFIPDIYDLWSEQSQTHMVMELIEGLPLSQSPQPWPAERVGGFLRVMLEQLAQLHAAGIVHRDIKPENIMQTPDGRYVLLDFGIAKQGAHTLTAAKALSLPYAPPEQFRGQTTDARSDLFSLAATAYALLAGAPPERADLRLAARSEPTPPSRLARAVPPQLDHALLAMLALEPARRPADARAALGLLAAPAVVATPPTPPQTIRVAGNPPVAAPPPAVPLAANPPATSGSTGCAWLIVLAVFLGGGFYGYRQQERGRQESTATALARQQALAAITDTPAPPTPDEGATAFALTATAAVAPTLTAQEVAAQLDALAQPAADLYVGGEIPHTEPGAIDGVEQPASASNLIAKMDCYPPYASQAGAWSCGFLFRHTGQNDHYRVYLMGDGRWRFALASPGQIGAALLAEGYVAELSDTPVASNRIELYVNGSQAMFFVNGAYAALLDTSAKPDAGSVWAATGLDGGDKQPGGVTAYANFSLGLLP